MAELEPIVYNLQARVENLEGWQKSQNGAIHELNAKMDRLYMWIIGLCGGVAVQLLLTLLRG